MSQQGLMAVNLKTVGPKVCLLLSCHLVCSQQHLSACPGGARHLAGAIVQGLDDTTGRAVSPLRPTFWKSPLPCVSNAPQVLLKRPLVCTSIKKVIQKKAPLFCVCNALWVLSSCPLVCTSAKKIMQRKHQLQLLNTFRTQPDRGTLVTP